MLRAYITAKSARLIMALLLFGSISGFVLGQEMHHPATTPHRVSATTASASGALGSGAPRVGTSASHTQTASIPRAHPSGHQTPTHHKGRHHQNDAAEGGGAITLSATSSGSVHASHGGGDSGDGGGDH